MQWVKSNVKLHPNMLVIQTAINGAKMFEYDKTRNYIYDDMKSYLTADFIGNYSVVSVGCGSLTLDIESFSIWIKRIFPRMYI